MSEWGGTSAVVERTDGRGEGILWFFPKNPPVNDPKHGLVAMNSDMHHQLHVLGYTT